MNKPIPLLLIPFIKELQALNVQQCDDQTNIINVSTILKKWIIKHEWLNEEYYQIPAGDSFKSRLIYEEDNLTLSVYVDAWMPNQDICPHDHQTWAVIGSVIGTEKNVLWRRVDDKSQPGVAVIQKTGKVFFLESGDVLGLLPDDIHSIVNESNFISISMQVYGKSLNNTNRMQFDPVKNTVKPFILNFD